MKPLLVAAVLVLSPGLALAQNLSGFWTISSTSGGAPITVQCNFLQRGGTLDGSCSQADGPSGTLIKGSVNGDHASWSNDFTVAGQQAHAEFKADITAEGSMKGDLTLSGQTSPFTALKG
jgi:hypothetical protein